MDKRNTPAERTLMLVRSNPYTLTSKGMQVFNAGVAECLANGWIKYAAKKHVGYAITPKGKKVLASILDNISQDD